MQFKNPKQQSFIDHQRTDDAEDLTDHDKYEREFWKEHGTDERLMVVSTPKEPEVPVIPFEQQKAFFDCLTDIQFCKFDPETGTKANTWVLTKKGTWLVQRNKSGIYGRKMNDYGIPTLPETDMPKAFFDLTYGKLPHEIYLQIVAFFREIMKRHNNAEAFVQVYWDLEEKKYVVHIPEQQVSGGSVKYNAEENLSIVNRKRYIFTYEAHSHNSMNAFWSSIDDADEKELRLYGVFGELDKTEFKCLHRYFVGEQAVSVDERLIFDLPKANPNPKYVVTHKSKQYLVNKEELILDDKPKYIFNTKDGDKVYIPVTDVAPVKEAEITVEVPKGWYDNVNVPLPKVTSSRTSLPGFQVWKKDPDDYMYGRNWDGGDGYWPEFPSTTRQSAMEFNEQTQRYESQEVETTPEEAEAQYEMMVQEVGSMAADLIHYTTDFEELEPTFAWLQTLEENGALKTLEKQIQNYYYRSRAEIEQGPSDGRY